MAGFSSTDMQELKDIVRIGQVSKVNAGEMTARVQIPDQGIVTGDLRIVKRPPTVECETGCKMFESSVNSYDSQTDNGKNRKRLKFESSINSYNSQGIYKLKDIVEENDMFEQEILYLNQELNELEKED